MYAYEPPRLLPTSFSPAWKNCKLVLLHIYIITKLHITINPSLSKYSHTCTHVIHHLTHCQTLSESFAVVRSPRINSPTPKPSWKLFPRILVPWWNCSYIASLNRYALCFILFYIVCAYILMASLYSSNLCFILVYIIIGDIHNACFILYVHVYYLGIFFS